MTVRARVLAITTTKRGQHCAAFLLYLAIILVFMGTKLFPEQGYALGGHDTRGLFVPWLTDVRQAVLFGSLPLWDAYQFSGNPFMSNPQIALFYPPTWLAVVLPVNTAISWHVSFHLLLAAMGMYLFVRAVSGRWSGAFIAGLVYAFSGFTIARIWAGHIGLWSVNAWLPWILLGTVWAARHRSFWSAVIAGVPWGLAILAGHSTSLFYVGLVWIGFLLYLAVDTKEWLLIIRQAVIMIVIGIALSSVQLLPFLQLSQNVARSTQSSFEFSTAFSLPLEQLVTLIVPDYFGDPVNGYWGAPYFEELIYYVGITAVLSFLFVFRRPSRLYWFYLLLAGSGLLLALGSNTPIYKLLYDLLPPLRLLRGPARAGILFVFAASGMLGDIVSHRRCLSDEKRVDRSKMWLRILLFAVLVAGVLAAIVQAGQFAAAGGGEAQWQAQLRLTGTVKATILAFAGLILIWLITSPAISANGRSAAYTALVGLILIDLWGFGYPLLTLQPSEPDPMWQDAQAIIAGSSARVLPWGVNIFEQNGAGQVGLKSVFGYNTLEPQAPIALAASEPDPRSQAYDVLGVGYVLSNVALEQYSDGEQPLQLLGSTDHVWVYERSRILPQVRLVNQVEIIADPEQALQRINQEDFDPLQTAILNRPPPCDLPTDPNLSGTGEIVTQGDGFWQIKTTSSSPALLVVSETAYPGWQVSIDGEQAEPLLAYTALRAVCVPPGEHEVIWEYKPSVFLWGALISLLTWVLIGVAVVMEMKANSIKSTEETA